MAGDRTQIVRTLKSTSLRRLEVRRDEDDRLYVAKTHLAKNPRNPTRARRRARREARALEHLHRHEIPCPRFLGLEEDEEGATLRLEHLELLGTLEDLFPTIACERRAAGRGWSRFAEALQLLSRAWNCGIVDPDLHAGNLLIGVDGTLFLSDLHRSRRRSAPLSTKARDRSLVRFLRFFVPFASRPELTRRLAMALPDLAAPGEIVTRTERSRRRLLAGKDRRALHGHRALDVRGQGGSRRFTRKDARPEAIAGAERVLEGDLHDTRELKHSKHSRVLHLPPVDAVLKLYSGPTSTAARRRVRRAWRSSLALEHSRVGACSALAAWERGALLRRWAAGPTLTRWVYDGDPRPREAARVRLALARMIASMHRDGLRMRDLRAENVLVTKEPGYLLRLIDYDGMGARRKIRHRAAARDLARLAASFPQPGPLSDRALECFLRLYARERGFDSDRLDTYRRAILERREELWRSWRGQGMILDEHGIHADDTH